MAHQKTRPTAEIRAEITTLQPEMARLILKERVLMSELQKSERHEETTAFRGEFKRTVGENWKWISVKEEEETIVLTFWEWTKETGEVTMPLGRAEALGQALLEVVAGARC